LPRRLLLILSVVGLSRFGVPARAQTQGPYKVHVESNQLQAPIRAESNMVLVPVFVFDRAAMGRVTPAEWQCEGAESSAFNRLLPSQAYMPEDCSHAEVHGLTMRDFRVLEGGVEQKIQQIAVEGCWVAARDNMTWHEETSVTPTGIWSSIDLFGVLRPDVVRRFYNLAYAPAERGPGCHPIAVSVDRPGTVLYARDQYCTGQSMSDPLYATNYGNRLGSDLASRKNGKIRLSVQASYFYTDEGRVRLEVAIEFPWKSMFHQWDPTTGSLYARIGVLGMVYREDASLAARFSDLLYPSYWPTFVQGGQVAPALLAAESDHGADGQQPNLSERVVGALSGKDPGWLPTRYETQIGLSPGEYDLQIVVSDTQKFGAAEVPLHIDNYDGRALGLSSVMLCKRFRDAHVAAVERAAANFAPQYMPLVSKNIEVTPSGDTHVKKGQLLIPYFEIYEPLLTNAPATAVQAHFRIIEAKNGNTRDDFMVDAQSFEQPGRTMIPIEREILTDKMPRGAYRLEVQATDSAGNSTPWRTAEFTVE